MKILIAEDDPISRRLLEANLLEFTYPNGTYPGRIKLTNNFIKKANKGKYRRALYKFK